MISIIHMRKISLFCRYGFRFCEPSVRTSIYVMPTFSRLSSDINLHPEVNHENKSRVNVKPSDEDPYKLDSDSFGTLSRSLESSARYKTRVEARKQKKIVAKKTTTVHDESDTFGNLSEKKPMWYPDVFEESKQDNDLDDDSILVKNISKRYRCPEKYLEEMKRLVKEKKVKEALGLFVDMKRNFVVPHHIHYTYMIGVCGRIGFTEMAFKLLRQMSDRCHKPTPAVLTGLFNACAESPYPEYGLRKARFLREKVERKSWTLDKRTYHAMIKAFGKCGDLLTAFQIVDEMANAEIKIDVETYSFLLMSCIANKEAGFTYAVEVWRKMKAKKCVPNIFTCNLFLRAARDCDIGPEEISCLLLQHWSSYSKRPYGFITKESLSKKPVPKLNSGPVITECLDANEDAKSFTENTDKAKIESSFQEKEIPKYEVENITNANVAVNNSGNFIASLLNPRPVTGPEILELVNIKTPNDRLSLIGGMEGFLKFMFDSKVKPDIKTFTLLLDCLPSNIEVEEQLLSVLESHHVTPDIDFCNMLIKRRNLRKESDSARNVLVLANRYGLTPDIVTFGVLALGCRTLRQATAFIDEMKKFGSSPNIEITGAMLGNACYIFDYSYMRFVLKLMEEQEIIPNEKVLLKLEQTLSTAKKNIIGMEQNKEAVKLNQHRNLSSEFKEFCIFYEDWLKRMKFESQAHPWHQYDTDIYDPAKEESVVY